MKLHANARTCPHSRRLAVDRVERAGLDACGGGGGRRRECAHGLEVAAPLPRGGRARAAGSLLGALAVPLRTGEERVALIAALRRLRMTGAEIAESLSMPASTVSGILTRIGLGKLSRLEPLEPANRYEKQRPGELVHIDVKKLGRIGRPGHRVTGRSPAAATTASSTTSVGSTSMSASTTRPGSSTSRSSTTSGPPPRSASCAARLRTSPPSASTSSG